MKGGVGSMQNDSYSAKRLDQTGSEDSLCSIASSGGDSEGRGGGTFGRPRDLGAASNLDRARKGGSDATNSSPRTLKLSRGSSREQILKEFDRTKGSGSPHREMPGDIKAETTCWFEVEVETEPGDAVVVTGNLLSLGFWDPRNGIILTTHASTYPKWSAGATFPSGESRTHGARREEPMGGGWWGRGCGPESRGWIGNDFRSGGVSMAAPPTSRIFPFPFMRPPPPPFAFCAPKHCCVAAHTQAPAPLSRPRPPKSVPFPRVPYPSSLPAHAEFCFVVLSWSFLDDRGGCDVQICDMQGGRVFCVGGGH